jgi:protein phosphatase
MSGLKVGVVCAAGLAKGPGDNADNYLLGLEGELTWLEGERERVQPAGGAGTLLAVCDGMGKTPAMASTSTVRVMAKLYRPGVPRSPTRTLLTYVKRAHQRLHDRARTGGPVQMGSTLTLAWVLEGRVHWVQVGNSRLYLLRDGELIRLTPEHTRAEFANRDGITVPDEPDRSAQAFLYGSVGLGDDSSLRLEPGLDAGVEYLQVDDRLVLCTDGLWGAVDDVSIHDVLRNVPEPQAAAVGLAERARSRGSVDDITVMVARVDRVPARTDPPGDEGRPGSGRTFIR